jgi:hypothetical protein
MAGHGDAKLHGGPQVGDRGYRFKADEIPYSGLLSNDIRVRPGRCMSPPARLGYDNDIFGPPPMAS